MPEMPERAVQQHYRAVDQMAASAAGQHAAQGFEGGEVGFGAASGVDAVDEAA